MGSPQTLSQGERRIVAAWAADCAERVVELFESPAAAAAARATGQAAAIPHMGAHALGAAAYAAKAAGLAAPGRPEATGEEIRWQLEHMSPPVRAALRQLPLVGVNPAGPLGRGLLASGLLGRIIREIQAGVSRPGTPARSRARS